MADLHAAAPTVSSASTGSPSPSVRSAHSVHVAAPISRAARDTWLMHAPSQVPGSAVADPGAVRVNQITGKRARH